jgi:hypothetical protein
MEIKDKKEGKIKNKGCERQTKPLLVICLASSWENTEMI